MGYRIYHTDAIILGTYNRDDASKVLQVYTRDIGLIHVRAQGVRRLESKLRYGLQLLSYSRISVVRGKHIWRVIDSHPIAIFPDILAMREKRDRAIHVVKLLTRLLDEGDHGVVFDECLDFFEYLDSTKDTDTLPLIELISMYRILYHLGYVQPTEEGESLLNMEWSEALFDQARNSQPMLVAQINQGLRETQL